MRGTDATTGRELTGDDHLRQSIADILMTPIGSRVMRRDYGSALLELLDQPWNAVLRMRVFGAVALAVLRWEKRIRLRKVSLAPVEGEPGAFLMQLEGDRRDGLGRTSLTRLTLPLRTRPLQGAAAIAF